ncbi:MAG: potassium transporter TrkG [Candidatus Omnitrophota bacterium]
MYKYPSPLAEGDIYTEGNNLMLLKPQTEDFKIIGFYIGQLIIGIGLVMFVPIITGLIFKEINPVLNFIISAAICFTAGYVLMLICFTKKELNWMQGMIVVSLSWGIAAFFGALPFYISGHWLSFIDAYFDAMSGFATTGMALVQDLDHLSLTCNMWRHFIMYVGGQGIVVVGLIFLLKGVSSSFKMYVGEAREEQVLPNVIATARFIWLVSIVYLVLGSLALTLVLLFSGLPLSKAILEGIWIFMAAFDTGGFTPYSQSIMYYHSFLFEIVTMFIMIIGAMNFRLHYCLWSGNKREIWRNIETITFLISMAILFTIIIYDLKRYNIYPEMIALFRKGCYQLVSAHTGTGYMTIYPVEFAGKWGELALFAIIVAMSIGGGICSTTGAIKTYRIGILFKALIFDVKKLILPESAVVIQKIHHIKDTILEPKHIHAAAMIFISFICLYLFGAVVGMICGYPFLAALFESVSAAANVGLSCGITTPAMPVLLKFTYIVQMWAGRLEFMAIFALIGFIISLLRGE